jgi:hypothetical protein
MSAIIARAILEENQEAIYEGLATALIKGNAYVYKELSDRAYGKVNTPVTVEAGEQLASILVEGRQRAAASRGNTALAAPAALPPAVEIIPSPAAASAPVAANVAERQREFQNRFAVAESAPVVKPAPAVPVVPLKTELSAEEHSQRFFDHIGGKRIHGNSGQ